MLQSLFVLASSAADEPSHAPFYVAAGLLAGWAVLVSIAGITRHKTFPANPPVLIGIVVITGALVVATVATAITTS